MWALDRLNVKKGKKSLLGDYIAIYVLMGSILLLSFWITSFLADSSMMEQSRNSSQVIYRQAQEQMEQVEEDLQNMQLNVARDTGVLSFLEAPGTYERLEILESVQDMVGSNRRINRNLENIIFYSKNEELIFAFGNVFLDKPDMELKELLNFSGRMWDDASKQSMFAVGLPIFQQQAGGYAPLGSAYLLFNVNNLQEIVNRALLNEESAIALVDDRGEYIVKAGLWQPYYGEFQEAQEDEERLIYADYVGHTGWRIVNVIPKKALLSGAAQMQQIIFFTYLSVVALSVFLCIMLYRRIIAPISRQTAFMAGFKKDTNRRIEVLEDNEIGEMAGKMNQMLDDIAQLNREVIDYNRRILEIEYAKKQTEMIAYRSQINPHFLYNTFNCIRGMALCQGQKDIAELTMALSSFFRYSVEGEETVTVLEALENLQRYAQIIFYRFGGKHRVIVDASRDIFFVRIPKMLLQPLVENAVLHGLEPKTGAGTVRLKVTAGKKCLVITVQDDGVGITEERLSELRQAMEDCDQDGIIGKNQRGIGFINVYRRMRLFYGQEAGFTVESVQGEGTTITMTLPTGG